MQEPIISKQKQNELKQREFREYIATHDVVLSIVKFLLSIKNSKEPVENPLKALNDYFGEYRDPSWDEFDNLKKEIDNLQNENQSLDQLIITLKQKLINAREEKIKQEEQEKLRLEEEAKKNTKKGGPQKK